MPKEGWAKPQDLQREQEGKEVWPAMGRLVGEPGVGRADLPAPLRGDLMVTKTSNNEINIFR